MSNVLYRLCPDCHGARHAALYTGADRVCECTPLRVLPTDQCMETTAVLERELGRRDLRARALTEELANASQEVVRLRSQLLTAGWTVPDAIVWWTHAAPADRAAFTEATGLRPGCGGFFVPALRAAEPGRDNGGGG